MLKEKKTILIGVLLVVVSFVFGISFNNYMTHLGYERMLSEMEDLEDGELLLTTHTPTSCLSLIHISEPTRPY